MTIGEKNLLLNDLSARLPYGVKVLVSSWDGFLMEYTDKVDTLYSINGDGYIRTLNEDYNFTIESVKPCLFPLSNLTKEQLYELKDITDFKYHSNTVELVEWTKTRKMLEFWLKEVSQDVVIEVFDWLNENHFDYRYLIEQGLAIDATGLKIY